MKYYTGIGSRETPAPVMAIMTRLASCLRYDGWTLRSGGARGADAAFARGTPVKDVFNGDRTGSQNGGDPFNILPSSFEETKEKYVEHRILSVEKIQTAHAWWSDLVLRSVFQVLGLWPMSNPVKSKFVVFWAPEIGGRVAGGTRYAVYLARKEGIKTFNLYKWEDMDKIMKYLDNHEPPPPSEFQQRMERDSEDGWKNNIPSDGGW